MISALHISTAGMTAASDRFDDIAKGIANPVADNAAQPAFKAEREVEATEPIAPVSAATSLDAQRLVDLVETEMAFKASAMATKNVAEASQALMDALR
ncbi:hypothetical protein [uncultured Cohaesibacter sp.]|uniref:hypothetical protein n=1 Tax=uncultured Cohaesibacter sp. TaxID=1002546 RepID=UPI00292E5D5B|nr:hypothetical protein [uncultured Cohaesibacter sp.]